MRHGGMILTLILAVLFVRGAELRTEIDRLTAFGDGWWKECDAVTSLYERVRSSLLQEKDAEKRRILAERVFDWALALPSDWGELQDANRFADEQIFFLTRTMDIPPLSASKETALKYAKLCSRFSERAEAARKLANEVWMKQHEPNSKALQRAKNKRANYMYAAYFGCWHWYASGRAAKLGESLSVEESERFARLFGDAANMDETSLKEMKRRLVGGAEYERDRLAEEDRKRQERGEAEKRAARERAEQEAAMKAVVDWLESLPLQDWENNTDELAKRIQQASPLFRRWSETEFAHDLARRIYIRVLSFPVEWTREDATYQVARKLGELENAILDPVLRDEGLALDYAARDADLRGRLKSLQFGDSDEERQRLAGYKQLRDMLLDQFMPQYLKGRAAAVCYRKPPEARAVFLDRYAAAARLTPGEKRKLVEEVLAEMPKPAKPEKPTD